VIRVSVTTYEEYKEDVCLLDVGDHHRVSHKSCIAYNEARMASLEKLTVLRDGGRLSEQESVSSELLIRIPNGVSKSKTIKYKFIEILLEQEVIE
jgi:hypothetical protein